MTADYPHAVWTPGPNFWPGRKGHTPRYICIHGTASPGWDIDTWARVAPTRGGVHYMVGRTSHIINTVKTQIIQFVHESDSAWGNGVVDSYACPWFHQWNPNYDTISVEHVKFMSDNTDALTQSQKIAAFDLITYLVKKYTIPNRFADGNGGITGHFLINPRDRWFCPGIYPWNELFEYVDSH